MKATRRLVLSILLSIMGFTFGQGEGWADPADRCENNPPEGTAEAFYEIVDTAVTGPQLAEMLAGIGEMGILADGSGRKTYDLPSGVTVPASLGAQPIAYKSMAPLPMPDNPVLLDELASGGVHSNGYNSSTSLSTCSHPNHLA